ncbi:MAG: M56 family metallopeptidase [Phycisphaerales bacterium]|jgi:type II secretory pathway component GspD/PulD (secretin)/beta-lactamase regulating signal transducer with metallopeptidase domain
MLSLQSILSQEAIQKLGWTLVHFIWQAATVALLLAIILKLLRKSSSSLRYIIACLALALVVLLPAVTIGFIPVSTPQPAAQIEMMPLPAFTPSELTPPAEITILDEPTQPESATPAASVSLIQRAAEFFEPTLPYIVSGWLIGVFGLSLWHLGGWAQLQRLRRKLVKKVDDTLYTKLDLLSRRLHLNQTVQLLESTLVQIPTVVGWIRPVILLPASALTGLASEQLEAILAHELAHIKRYDYLVNILQTIVEILGFYHPAVWWISHKIRAERENCCDDLAVNISGDRVCYARALTSMEEIRTARGQLAVAVTGGSLFQRIYRLVGKDSTEKTPSSWIPAATAILLIIAIIIPTTLALSSPETKQSKQEFETQSEVTLLRAESADKLKKLGLALALYADDNDDNLPKNLQQVKPYMRDEQDFDWLLNNVEYFISGDTTHSKAPFIPIAYDKTLFIETDATNVLFLDFSARFLNTEQLEEIGITADTFLLETQFCSVSENFLKSIGSNASSPDEAKELSKLKSELLKAHNDSKCLILDDLQVSLLLGAVKAQGGSVRLAVPQIMAKEGKTAEIGSCLNEYFYIPGYTEPNNPSDEPKPRKLAKVEEGFFLSLIPKLTPDKNIDMEFELEITQILGFEEHKYKGKYTYSLPSTQSITQNTRYIAHNGHTLLLGGYKIPDKKDDQTEQKDLLILVTAKALGLSEQDKSTQAQNPTAAKSNYTFIKPVTIRENIIRPNKNMQQPDIKSKIMLARLESADKLRKLGIAVVMYANDNDKKLPDNLQPLKPYINNEVDYQWFLDNVEYLGKDKTYRLNQPDTPIAYDQTFLGEQPATNVLFMDAHVEYVSPPKLEEFGIAAKACNLEVLNIEFDPIHQGKNAVHVTVKNKTDKEQLFRIHIYTRSPELGKSGVGWGTPFFETIPPNETKSARFVYKIQGPITNSTWLRLSFRNPESDDPDDSQKIKPFLEKKYVASDLERLQADAVKVKPASQTQTDAVIHAFENIQNLIKNKNYKQAWELFTEDYKKADFQRQRDSYKRFEQAMEPTHPLHSAFVWEKEQFLKLQPESVFQKDGVLTLNAVLDQQTWKIDFTRENGRWKIDWIGGYTPGILIMQDWQNLLLPKMEKHSTEHFDIYYFKNSTAEKQLDQIADEKEKGFKEICKFLEKDSDIRIRMIFFEDDTSKQNATGHQGDGWAFGNTIVEIYNEEQKLDPYHETTHILMGPFGNPPALFNEGFAVYISERLGAHALKSLSGGTSTIYQRTRQLKSNNEWIPLEELITYTEIGSYESKPPIAYAEAASFVKFLIENYGKTKFLQAYKTLKNSNNVAVQQQNIKELEQIYGQSLQQLQKDWENSFQKSDSHIKAVKDSQLPETEKRLESARKLSALGKALIIYANDHNDKYPDSMRELEEDLNEEEFEWVLANVKYLARGKTPLISPDSAIAYDKTLLKQAKGTNVLFNDLHIDFTRPEILKGLETGLNKTAILAELNIIYVDEDFWQKYIEDANLAPQINPVSGKSEPASRTFSLILDDPDVSSFLEAVKANKNSKMLAAPQINCNESKTAEVGVTLEELYYVSGYNKPSKPSDEPKPKIDKVKSGVHFSVTPKLKSDRKNIILDFNLEIAEIKGHREHTYLDKYTHMVPVVTRITTSTTAVIPNGKTLLLGGRKISTEVENKTGVPILKEIPLVGGPFRDSTKTTEQKILIMLIRPTIYSPEKVKTTDHEKFDNLSPYDPLPKKLEEKLKRSNQRMAATK